MGAEDAKCATRLHLAGLVGASTDMRASPSWSSSFDTLCPAAGGTALPRATWRQLPRRMPRSSAIGPAASRDWCWMSCFSTRSPLCCGLAGRLSRSRAGANGLRMTWSTLPACGSRTRRSTPRSMPCLAANYGASCCPVCARPSPCGAARRRVPNGAENSWA